MVNAVVVSILLPMVPPVDVGVVQPVASAAILIAIYTLDRDGQWVS
jgi:hypothetical protein